MNDTSQKIVNYLKKHGKMSGSDIVNDLGVEEWEVDLACRSGYIRRVIPMANASSFQWFDVIDEFNE